ncbi:MAG: LysE family translocator [Alphaproteobacteria bacterium]|nr:MAG: LysE family translocator [Alphaproteobacteria bacterium]
MIFGLDPVAVAGFVGAGVVLNLTPGADVMFASASGLAGGPRRGVAAALGVSLGSLLHGALAAFGLAALLAAWPSALAVVKAVGAGYLLYLARKTWGAPSLAEGKGARGTGQAVWRGFVTNALNPKVALFVVAFLPQFTSPESGPVSLQILLLAGLFAVSGFVITGAYGAMAGCAAKALGRAGRWLNRLSGAVYAGLALRIVLD